jgi:hypothetical protein
MLDSTQEIGLWAGVILFSLGLDTVFWRAYRTATTTRRQNSGIQPFDLIVLTLASIVILGAIALGALVAER